MSESAVRRAVRLAGSSGGQWATCALGAVSAVSTTALVIVVGLIFDLLLKRDDPSEATLSQLTESWSVRSLADWPWLATYDTSLLTLIALFFLLGLLEAALLLVLHRFAESAGLRVMARLQTVVGKHAVRLGMRTARDMPSSKAGELLTEACDQVRREVAARWRIAPRTVVLLPLLLAVGLAMDFFLALYALLLVVFAVWTHRLYRGWLDRHVAACQELAEHRREVLQDRMQTEVTVSTCSPETELRAEFEEHAQRFRQPLQQAAFWEATRIPALVLLVSLCAGLLALVVGLSSDANMTRVLLLSLIYARGYIPARRLRQIWSESGQGEQAAAEILDFLDQTPAIGPDGVSRELERPTRSIRFEDVSAARDAGAGLDAITLDIPAGARVAWVAERTETLLLLTDLLLRHCDPDSGRVLLDEVDLREFSLASVRRQFAFVPRYGQMLTGTIADNLRCGRPGIMLDRLEQVAASCRVLDFIQQSSHGFHTTIGPLGRNPGPEIAFRLGLARALAAEPSVIVIEEPHEPRDDDARHQLDLAMAAATDGRTSIVIASRLSTLRTASQVMVFHQGRLHSQGEHTELLKQDALYRHLNYLWFNPFTGSEDGSRTAG
ncbi:MAG: ABC transporter ATP-binding protein/permease [Pirellulaceae bacterium]|nr:ABC transporter ATP-binding protein/permease [Pirellulaceae bacterium]